MHYTFLECRLLLVAAATIFRRICTAARSSLIDTQKASNIHIHSSPDSPSPILNAPQVFDEVSDLDVVSATSIIGSFSKQHQHKEAILLFSRMLFNDIRPNEFTFGTVIHSSTLLKDLNIGKQLHACAIKMGLTANIAAHGMGKSFHACVFKCLGDQLNVFTGNALISFYAKCGSMEDSLLVFNKLHSRNIVSWNALICGYAQNGRGKEAIEFFEKMLVSGFRPNDVTLLGLLWACNHAGLVAEGYSYFNKARAEEPNLLKPEHYACVVDLLSRSGHFKEAEEFIQHLPFEPGIGFWKALLGGCQIHSNTELGEFAAKKIMALDPEDVSSYIMLSNAHVAAGRWEIASTLRREMKEKQMKRIPGCSWIEVRNQVHVFLSRDRKHSQMDEIHRILRFCIQHSQDSEASSFLMEFYI
ncbi:Pentatricopeptide repeat - like 10 [Theobroma cacao]|nr:Pentatricopeptide repeat - like 10 [Theobroma cacao]